MSVDMNASRKRLSTDCVGVRSRTVSENNESAVTSSTKRKCNSVTHGLAGDGKTGASAVRSTGEVRWCDVWGKSSTSTETLAMSI